MLKADNKTKALVALVAANIIWGITPAFNKMGLEQFSPLWLFVIRYSIATIIFMLFFRHHGRKINNRDHLRIAISAWVGISLTIVTMYYGLRITKGIDAAIIGSLGPMILFWLSIIFLRERFRWQPLIGTLIALCGSMIIVLKPLSNTDAGGSTYLLGGLLIFISILMDQIGCILTKPMLDKYQLSQLALWRMVYAVGPVLLLAVILEPIPMQQISARTAGSLAYLVIAAIVIAFPLFYYGARRLDVEDFNVLFYIDPIFGVLSSMLLLGERPSFIFGAGVACIVMGIIITEIHISTKAGRRLTRLQRY